ncbi:SDR family NAD(P)-dependent oxidoreductase, partial [Mesorhizobium humile]|uniref:SDR family NAD(P)-dependent oxidoreductase n=1 Tax=Mesorhizobium humile TaxID=3072313 RepID=UPI002A24636E
MFLPCDVTDIAALRAAIENVREKVGPVAVLVNNAANDDRHAVAEVTPDYWDHRGGEKFWSLVNSLGVRILPNTAGCHSAKEAVTTAKMAREVFGTSWIKLEVIGNHDTLQPDVFGLVEAARILCEDGFTVFPYTTDDLVVAERLLGAGCKVLMPWCAPIGSALGPINIMALRSMRGHFPDVPLIVDAGLGR